MNKGYLAPLALMAVIFVGAAFLIVSAAVALSKGKSSFFTSKKMKLGAILLSLNAIVSGGCLPGCQTTCYDVATRNGGEDPEVLCYDVVAVNVVSIDAEDFVQRKTNLITGNIGDPTTDDYSYFLVKDKTNDTIQSGGIVLNDSDTIRYDRSFSVEIKTKLEPGTYWFFVTTADQPNFHLESYQINME